MISILYVDDETTLLDVTKIYLERTGEFSVDTSESAAAALAMLPKKNYDAIVSDYQMPGMDGIEFLKVLRKEYPKLPFIIFTGKGREEVVIQAFDSGADFYLQKGGAPKPQFAELTRKISSIVDQRKSEAKAFKLNRLYSVLSATNHAIIHRRNVKDLMEEICRIATEIGGFRMAWAGRINEDTQDIEPFASCGYVEGYFDTMRISSRDVPEGRGPTGTAYRESRYVIVNDLASEPSMAPWREEAQTRGYGSIAAYPFAMGTQYAGTFTLYAGEPGFFDGEIVKLLAEMMRDITFTLRTLEDEEARAAAMEKIRRDGEKFRSIFNALPVLIMSINRSGLIVDCNQRILESLGYAKDEIIGKPLIQIVSPDLHMRTHDLLQDTLTLGEVRNMRLCMLKKDGTPVEVSVSSSGLKDRNGLYFRAVWIVEDINPQTQTTG